MTVLDSFWADLAATAAYCGAGVVLMAVGYVLVDIVTPGNLRDLIWVDRNRNAALLLASNLAGVGAIVVAAIVASDGNLLAGVLSAGGYGVLGLAVMAVAFVLLDLVTPGRLGELLVEEEPNPAVWVSAVIHLAVAAIVVAAIL